MTSPKRCIAPSDFSVARASVALLAMNASRPVSVMNDTAARWRRMRDTRIGEALGKGDLDATWWEERGVLGAEDVEVLG